MRTTIVLFLVLIASPVIADNSNFRDMSLEELRTYEISGLTKKEAKAHRKALKKAAKAARREARRNAPKAPYCNKLARARGSCG